MVATAMYGFSEHVGELELWVRAASEAEVFAESARALAEVLDSERGAGEAREVTVRGAARVFADEELLEAIRGDDSLVQLQNVATLPGIVEPALAMPDIHQGYGFPVGAVAATALPDGVISPGGVGYDINCGVRLLALPLSAAELGNRRDALVHEISRRVPVGTGQGGAINFTGAELD